jgi:tetratricopeptide (TPR) repeat protein
VAITPSQQRPKDYLLVISIGLILALVASLAVWSNHFRNSFHFDDIPTIVTNPSLSHLSNVGRFFTNPRIFSLTKENADYRPLLSTWFALDYQLGGGAKAFIFQAENFVWFGAQLVLIFWLFRVIPGGGYPSALFGTLFYALHPVASDTVNYPLQRGIIMGSFGVISGLLIWIVYPRLLPQKLPVKLKRVPQHGLDQYLRTNFQKLDARYRKIIHAPVGLYLWPIVLALLVDPAAAVFGPILLAYILIFETERRPRSAMPAMLLCGGYWIFQTFFTWNFGAPTRLPALNYWISQPWVTLRYFFKFFIPVHLSADTDLIPFAQFWSPLALAGYAGLAALAGLAIYLGRRSEWRAVAFGIWWFLIALAPYAIVPHRVVEANWRMYLPFAGLALAVSRTAWIAFALVYYESHLRVAAAVGFAVLAVGALAALGWATWHRNSVWETEATLWTDVMQKSPGNARGFMNFGLTRAAAEDPAGAVGYFLRAQALAPRDVQIEINLGRGYNALSRPADAEGQFRRAIAEHPGYSPAYSAYAQWLQAQQRFPEAFRTGTRAIALDAWDLDARRTVMELLAEQHEWQDLKRAAHETLRVYPDSTDGQRLLQVAQTGIDQVDLAEKQASADPSVDHYLSLSVYYYENQRYEDCIRAAREALKIDPNLAEAYANMATAYHTLGKVDEAIAALREEVRINPGLRSAQKNLNYELAKKAAAGH